MPKITSYAALASVQPDDLLVGVDVHDTSMSAQGTTKQLTFAQIQYQPWQFIPESYGAVGNGKVISDLVLNGTTTATSASANFTSAVTGMTIMINGAIGGTNIPLITTITYSNSTTITLGSAASASGSAFAGVYGTDDTAAINSAISAAKTYALANQYFAEVIFGPKIYMLTSGPTQATSPQTNAQVVIPWPNVNGTTQKLVIALTGAGDCGFYQFFESTTPNVTGTALVSTLTAPSTPSGTYGEQSVVGGPSAGGAFTGNFANTKIVVKGIEVVCPAYTNLYAYDFGFVSAMRVRQSSAHIFAPPGPGGGNAPVLSGIYTSGAFTAKIGCGLRSPVTTNNADCVIDDFTAEGYARGLYLFDHLTATRIGTIYNDASIVIDSSLGPSGIEHGIFISLLGAEAYNGGILSLGTNYVPVYIRLDAECTGPTYDISDVGNQLYGEVRWTDPADSRLPVVSGAANLAIWNDKLGPGYWSAAPVTPASGSVQVNTAYRPAHIGLSSTGTITAMTVDSTALPVMPGSISAVFVPSGHSWTPTYSGSLSATWMLS